MTERWVPVVGYEGLYEVSDHGRVRSVDRIVTNGRAGRGSRRTLRGKLLTPRPTPTGYLRVQLSSRDHYVHRMVLEAFVSRCPRGKEACHFDGDRGNNRLSNLRWDSRLGNCQDQIRHGTHPNLQKDCCPYGHAYDGTANGWKSKRTGQRLKRVCLQCRRDRYRRRKMAA